MRFCVSGLFAVVFAAGCLCASAQGGRVGDIASAPEPGYATGHVTCSDTQRPARLAQVRFVPMPGTTQPATEKQAPKSKMNWLQTSQLFGSELNPVETDVNGDFTARNLKPGRYVVRVDLDGYVTPLLSMAPSDFEQPDEAARQRMTRELQIVDVRPRSETRVDVTLQRGATLGGTVRFDDGSPAIGIATELLTKSKAGKWESARLSGLRYGNTDALGRYEVDGVPPGDYLVRAQLALNEFSNGVLPMNGNQVHIQMTKTIFSLPVYTGSVLRERDATPVEVKDSGEYSGNDITLPISKLHRVSGAVMGGGHALNGGKLVLQYADDHSEVATVDISREDRQFHFPYVPEGSYVLSVEEARDVTEVEVPNAPGVLPKTHLEERTVRTYGKTDQPLIVQSDVEGVLATVPEAKGRNPAGTAQAAQ